LEFDNWDLEIYGFAVVGCSPYGWWVFSGGFGEDNTGTTQEQHRNNTTTTLLKQGRGIGSKGQGGKGIKADSRCRLHDAGWKKG